MYLFNHYIPIDPNPRRWEICWLDRTLRLCVFFVHAAIQEFQVCSCSIFWKMELSYFYSVCDGVPTRVISLFMNWPHFLDYDRSDLSVKGDLAGINASVSYQLFRYKYLLWYSNYLSDAVATIPLWLRWMIVNRYCKPYGLAWGRSTRMSTWRSVWENIWVFTFEFTCFLGRGLVR